MRCHYSPDYDSSNGISPILVLIVLILFWVPGHIPVGREAITCCPVVVAKVPVWLHMPLAVDRNPPPITRQITFRIALLSNPHPKRLLSGVW